MPDLGVLPPFGHERVATIAQPDRLRIGPDGSDRCVRMAGGIGLAGAFGSWRAATAGENCTKSEDWNEVFEKKSSGHGRLGDVLDALGV